MQTTISKKINILICGLLGLLFVAGIFGFFGLTELGKNADALKEEIHIIDEVQEIRVSFQQLLMPAYDYVTTGDTKDIGNFEIFLQKTNTSIAACKKSLNAHSYCTQQGNIKERDIQLLDSVSSEVKTISSLSHKLFQLARTEKVQADALLDKMDAIAHHVTSELSLLIDDAHVDAEAAIKTTDAIEANMRNYGSILLGVMLVAGIGLGLKVSGPIKTAIGELSIGTEKIAAGQLNYQVHVKTHDELKTLADAFNQMTDSIRNKNEELETMNEELRSTNEELETSNEELRSTTEELEASNEELRSTTEELEVSNEELQQAHEKLLHQKKLAAIGQLASGIGHELRNPLGVVKNAVYYIKTKIGNQDEKLTKHLNIMDREINNSNKIINDLLGFSRTKTPTRVPEDANKIVEQSLEVVQVPKNVLLVSDTDGGLPKISVDKSQLQQVLVNLCLNGIQAMEAEGGQLQVSTHAVDDFVHIKISDTGCGIPEENLNKLFDPFFTTKAKGVGLGLAVTYGIIEKHQGAIEVQSQSGQGTTFIVKLPAVKDTVSQTSDRLDTVTNTTSNE